MKLYKEISALDIITYAQTGFISSEGAWIAHSNPWGYSTFVAEVEESLWGCQKGKAIVLDVNESDDYNGILCIDSIHGRKVDVFYLNAKTVKPIRIHTSNTIQHTVRLAKNNFSEDSFERLTQPDFPYFRNGAYCKYDSGAYAKPRGFFCPFRGIEVTFDSNVNVGSINVKAMARNAHNLYLDENREDVSYCADTLDFDGLKTIKFKKYEKYTSGAYNIIYL